MHRSSPELVKQIAFTVIGQDLIITMAAEAGKLQLNAFEPVMVHYLLTGLHYLAARRRTTGLPMPDRDHRRQRGGAARNGGQLGRVGHRAEPHRRTGTAGPQDATAIRLSAQPPTTITGGTA